MLLLSTEDRNCFGCYNSISSNLTRPFTMA